jgi:hypothetical protein
MAAVTRGIGATLIVGLTARSPIASLRSVSLFLFAARSLVCAGGAGAVCCGALGVFPAFTAF